MESSSCPLILLFRPIQVEMGRTPAPPAPRSLRFEGSTSAALRDCLVSRPAQATTKLYGGSLCPASFAVHTRVLPIRTCFLTVPKSRNTTPENGTVHGVSNPE